MQRHTEAGGLDHIEIIGAIADSDGGGKRQGARFGQGLEAIELGGLVDNRARHRAGQRVAVEFQHIGNGFIKADALADIVGKESEAAGDEGREGAEGLHGLHQRAAARRIGDALATDFLDDAAFEPLDQTDAVAQRLLEIQFTIHGAGGDFGDLRFDPHGIGQLVDAFLLDHGRIHIGDQNLLAAVLGGDECDIDGAMAGEVAGDGLSIRGAGIVDLGGDLLVQPVDLPPCLVLDRLQELEIERGIGGVGDEAENGHPILEIQAMGGWKNGLKRAVLIAGPTASGKSALALRLARQRGGLIINTDALQVYDGLRLLTARPSEADLAVAEHRLYGTIDPAMRFSTGDWARAVSAVLAEQRGRELIFVGGTGLYFETLTNGFADVPEVPPEAVAAAEAEIDGLDAEGRGKLIASRDPLMAARLKAPDPQRVTRALAVLAATGRSLASFQDAPQPALLAGYDLERLVLNPDRDVLRERIAVRFHQMFAAGAVDEVMAVLARGLDASLPAMKAIGVPEIAALLRGELEEAEAIAQAIIATRQYAKRQRTWFRGRMGDWRWVDPDAM